MTKTSAGAVGRVLLSAMLVATIVSEIAFTWLGWTGDHVFNPQWHPHARYHAAWSVGFVAVLALVGLWLLWRYTNELGRWARTVAVVAVAYWGTEFFAFAVPGTSASPDLGAPNTISLFGLDVHGNHLFAVLMIMLSVLGARLAGAPTTATAAPAPTPR